MSGLLTLTVALAITCLISEVVQDYVQQPTGLPNFEYSDQSAQDAAEELQMVLVDADQWLYDYVEKLKVSNDAAQALKKYYDAVESVAGTKCAVPKSETDQFIGSKENVETITENCAAFVPLDDREILKAAIIVSVAKVQTYDNILQNISTKCNSPESCKEDVDKIHNDIQQIISPNEMVKLYYKSRVFSFNVTKTASSCVEEDTRELKSHLEFLTRRIKNCDKTLPPESAFTF